MKISFYLQCLVNFLCAVIVYKEEIYFIYTKVFLTQDVVLQLSGSKLVLYTNSSASNVNVVLVGFYCQDCILYMKTFCIFCMLCVKQKLFAFQLLNSLFALTFLRKNSSRRVESCHHDYNDLPS